MWETQVQSLGSEDLMKKGMTTHSSIPAWRIPGTEEPSKLQSMGSHRVGHDWATNNKIVSALFGSTYTKIWDIKGLFMQGLEQ